LHEHTNYYHRLFLLLSVFKNFAFREEALGIKWAINVLHDFPVIRVEVQISLILLFRFLSVRNFLREPNGIVRVIPPLSFVKFLSCEQLQSVPGHVIENVEESLITEFAEVGRLKEEIRADIFYLLFLRGFGVYKRDVFFHVTKI